MSTSPVRSAAAIARQSVLEPVARRWIRLDTDWQSVACAAGVLVLVVGFGIPIPE